jgi:hypothetical protein
MPNAMGAGVVHVIEGIACFTVNVTFAVEIV